MGLLQFFPGATFALTFDFRTKAGDPTSVSSVFAQIYTPARSLHDTVVLSNVAGVTHQYTMDFFAASGLTPGHWLGLASGITQGSTLIADPRPFELINPVTENIYLSVEEYREYIDEDATDHTRDEFYKRMLSTSMDHVEKTTRQVWGLKVQSQSFEVGPSPISIKDLGTYPIESVVGITALADIVPSSPDNPNAQSFTGTTCPFFYLIDDDTGYMRFVDNKGLETTYDSIFLSMDLMVGHAKIPEPIRTAGLAMTSFLINLATSEGIDNVRLSDLNFVLGKNLLKGHIGDLLAPYIRRGF